MVLESAADRAVQRPLHLRCVHTAPSPDSQREEIGIARHRELYSRRQRGTAGHDDCRRPTEQGTAARGHDGGPLRKLRGEDAVGALQLRSARGIGPRRAPPRGQPVLCRNDRVAEPVYLRSGGVEEVPANQAGDG